jgi:small subunit ribosomal protein S2
MAKTKIELKDLLESGAHFGHQASRWNPKMKPFLYSVRDGVHVFDLAKTKEGLEKAADFAKGVAASGGKIVFLGTKRQAKAIIIEEAKKAGMPFVSERWLGGTITNWGQIKKRIDRLADMKEKRGKGKYKKYTKKEQILIDREIARLEKFFGGLSDLADLPAALLVVDTKKEHTAVREANRKEIPVIGIVDSNSDPDLVDYAIPANDDAVGSVKLIVSVIADAIIAGHKKSVKKLKKSKKSD